MSQIASGRGPHRVSARVKVLLAGAILFSASSYASLFGPEIGLKEQRAPIAIAGEIGGEILVAGAALTTLLRKGGPWRR